MGTSNGNVIPAFANEDHPHAYGDKFAVFINQAIIPGSSPRVWGQELEMIYVCFSVRIIPTRMGTSETSPNVFESQQDHPHAYGDKLQLKCLIETTPGSSPRVWGQGCICLIRRNTGRIIPTRMGTSRYAFKLFDNVLGSSPRVWGQVTHKSIYGSADRIIPTRMGTRWL